jgi:hypothetical protein
MRNKLPLAKRIHVLWIAICETRKLAVMATLPIPDREEYAQRHVLKNLKQRTLAASLELSTGRKPYEFVNAIVDAAIQAEIPEYRASLGVRF